MRGVPSASRAAIRVTAPQARPSQLWAENRRPASVPAMAGEGALANSSGTAMKPMALRLPHQRAAASTGSRAFQVIPGIS